MHVKWLNKLTSFKSKNHISTSKPLKLLHIDLFEPTRILVGKMHTPVVVDDTQLDRIPCHKDEALKWFYKLCKKIKINRVS